MCTRYLRCFHYLYQLERFDWLSSVRRQSVVPPPKPTRAAFRTVAPPSQVVCRLTGTGRPRGFAFVNILIGHAEQAIQQFNGQPFNGRPLMSARREPQRPRTGADPAVVWTAAARRFCSPAALVVRRAATSLRSVGAGSPAQPEFRTRRQAATRRQCKGQEERRRASARPHPPQENRAIFVPRRRLSRRGAAGHRRFRHQPATGRSRQGRRRFRRREGQQGRQRGRISLWQTCPTESSGTRFSTGCGGT